MNTFPELASEMKMRKHITNFYEYIQFLKKEYHWDEKTVMEFITVTAKSNFKTKPEIFYTEEPQ